MNPRLPLVIAVTLTIICAATPSRSVTVATRAMTMAGQARRSAPKVRELAFPGLGAIKVTYPAGCTTNGSQSFVGGGFNNYAGGSQPSTSQHAAVVEGDSNEACDDTSIIGAGDENIIGGDNAGGGTVIAAGEDNRVEGAIDSIIGSGLLNAIGVVAPATDSDFSAILGGYGNTVGSGYAVLGGGNQNVVAGSYGTLVGGSNNIVAGVEAFIGGGYENSASGLNATGAGGYGNKISGIVATVGGGYENTASGQNATIPGGASNVASGRDSFAAGNGSQAKTDGSFVWSDFGTGAKTLVSSAPNQFLARASGGFQLFSSAALTTGVKLAPGSGSWSTLSDRGAKTRIEAVDDTQILAKVAAMPVSEWSYIAQGAGIRHVGPMAQDFRAAFGLGEDNKHISTVDEEGVALAAIKALQSEIIEKDRKLSDLDAKYERLEKRLDSIDARGRQKT